jgi:hypothetical protein
MVKSLQLEAFLFRALNANALIVALEEEDRLLARAPLASEPASSAIANFSPSAQTQANRMGEVYKLLYCLENSVRELVESTLREEYGAENWWLQGVPEKIRKSADSRKKDDLKARWHGPRGESPLNYVDFPQYADVIIDQWALFEDLLGDRDWVVSYFNEMNRTRRALAHTGHLSAADVARMELRVEDWLRVVG